MLMAVGIQTGAVMFGVVVALIFGGLPSAQSFLMGGAAAVVPNVVFAVYLTLKTLSKPSSESYLAAFVVGELVKVGCVIAALGLIVKYAPNASWFEVILGLIVGLKSQMLGLWFSGDRTDRVIRQAEQAKAQAKA